MQLVSLSDVVVGERQRTSIDTTQLGELKQSIRDRGLFHPPTMTLIEDKLHLVMGERRFRAIESLAKEGIAIRHNGETLALGVIPYNLLSDAGELESFVAELEENIVRVDLSWQDKTRALAKLHEMRKALNPAQTQKDTATEIVKKLGGESASPPPNLPTVGAVRAQLSRSSVLAANLHRPEISKARNETEAYNLVLKAEEERFTAELIRRRKAAITEDSLRCEVRVGSAADLLLDHPSGVVDLILSDPPYGVYADSAPGFRARSVLHHNYEDTPEYAREVLRTILTEGWRVSKPKANLFLFTDIKHFEWLVTFSAQMGWKPWRYPIIWQKSLSEGLTPWQGLGPVHTYDVIFYATKGFRGLRERILDILPEPRVKRNEKLYAAEKPLPLLCKLISAATLPGELVLDPCCGSGSTLIAARSLKRPSLGFEIDPKVADLALVRIAKGDAAIDWSLVADTTDNTVNELLVPEGV
jgi:DNA modification methylase